MVKNSNQKNILIMFLVLFSIVSTTFLITILARGYIPEFDNGLKIKATGILSATSIPKNANVIINDKLYSTTDDAINLIPGDYQLKITKEGYLPWNKKISIQKEVVTKADASLFKTTPKILSLTSTPIINPTINSDFSKIIFIVPPSTLSSKPGIYLAETNYYLSLVSDQFSPKLISLNPFLPQDTSVAFTFSPNSKQVIAKSTLKHTAYLIDLTNSDSKQNIKEIVYANQTVNEDWDIQTKQIEVITKNRIPEIFTNTVATNPASIQFSYDENKIMYLANNQYYVYDIEKNINHPIQNLKTEYFPFWLPKSDSIIYLQKNEIKSIEFDGSNNNTIYKPELKLTSISPHFDGEKLNLNSNSSIFQLTIK